MQNGSLVNTDNLALTVMQAGIRKMRKSSYDEPRQRAYLKAVRLVVDMIKAQQKLTQEQQESIVALIYHDQTERGTMNEMRKILREIGHEIIQCE